MRNFQIKNKRLFTFGCSFTEYIWPTWADILGQQHEYFENWGMAGAGNLYIFNSIIEANQRHKFTKEDTVIIMWSGLNRVDYYHTNNWCPQGGEFVFDKTDITGYEVINYAYIDAVIKLFEATGMNYKMLSLAGFTKKGKVYDLYRSSIDEITNYPYNFGKKIINVDKNKIQKTYYYNLIENNYNRNKGLSWPNFDKFFFDPDLKLDKNIKLEIEKCMENFTQGFKLMRNGVEFRDYHPTPKEHLISLNKLFPSYEIYPSTLTWVNRFEEMVLAPNYILYKTNLPERL
jgi:hypothetical protein